MKTIILASLLSASLAHAAPAKQAAPKEESGVVKVAECRDGKTMYGPSASEHRGACSGHGGVAAWADGSPVKGSGKKTSYR